MATDTQFVTTPSSWSTRIGYLSPTDSLRIYLPNFRDGSVRLAGTPENSFALLAEFGAQGGRIDNLSIVAVGAVGQVMTNNVVRFFLQKPNDIKRLYAEYEISGKTPTVTTKGYENKPTGLNWAFGAGDKLFVTCQAATSVADIFDVIVSFGGEF